MGVKGTRCGVLESIVKIWIWGVLWVLWWFESSIYKLYLEWRIKKPRKMSGRSRSGVFTALSWLSSISSMKPQPCSLWSKNLWDSSSGIHLSIASSWHQLLTISPMENYWPQSDTCFWTIPHKLIIICKFCRCHSSSLHYALCRFFASTQNWLPN